eukprot:Hpha_TRINITY_DN10915_c0_g1::TRINITY_DN10915_c0_g1_i1::g.26736::m.26736
MPGMKDMCMPCAAVFALSLAACRLYGLLAPLDSSRGRCRATQSTEAGAHCERGSQDDDQGYYAVLPDVTWFGDEGWSDFCSIKLFSRSNSSCQEIISQWISQRDCDPVSPTPPKGKVECQTCWYEPWRRDGETLSGLLFGRSRLDGCDVVGDDTDSWSASILYLLVAGALVAYLVAFCCRCNRDEDRQSLLGSDAGTTPRVVERASPEEFSDIAEHMFTAGTPQGRHCSICMENPLCVVLEPCMHLAVCASCATSVRYCPICRNAIHKRLQIEVRDFAGAESLPSSNNSPADHLYIGSGLESARSIPSLQVQEAGFQPRLPPIGDVDGISPPPVSPPPVPPSAVTSPAAPRTPAPSPISPEVTAPEV